MNPIIIMAVGMAIVIGGILLFRWHAFLSLLAGALAVALLTPTTARLRGELTSTAIEIVAVDNTTLTLATGSDIASLPNTVSVLRGVHDASDAVQRIGELEWTFAPTDANDRGEIRVNISGAVAGSIRSGDSLISQAAYEAAEAISNESAADSIATGFGDTCRKIGILIALAAIIGACLLESGAARRIVDTLRVRLGVERTPMAFMLSGFVVGIPVFFDTVFYLLLPLAKAMYQRTGKDYVLLVMSVVVGGTMAHSLVPPTPGPLFVANELGVAIGTMMLAGIAIGLFASFCGFAYVKASNRWWPISPPEMAIQLSDDAQQSAALEASSERSRMPSLLASLVPILLPVMLLSVATFWTSDEPNASIVQATLAFLGDKNIALGISAAFALVLLWRYPGRTNSSAAVGAAITGAGGIILLTAAGGAFGHVLRQTGISEELQQRFLGANSGFALLWLAFGLTALVRFAQGSATVAMITSVAIVSPLAATGSLAFHPVYLALAVGCGSKPLPWMNDSGFWVVGRMSGFTERETLRTFSVTLSVMGISGFAATLIAAWLFPAI
jgi:GntP family gluconate:H+ symporter